MIRYAVLTFGLVSLLVNGPMIALVAQLLPGFEVGSYPVAFALSLYLAVVNLVLGVALDLDWADSWYRQVTLGLMSRERHRPREPKELVGSHGGLGGAQTEAFVLYPSSFAEPTDPIVGAPAVHRVLVGWLEALGLRGAIVHPAAPVATAASTPPPGPVPASPGVVGLR